MELNLEIPIEQTRCKIISTHFTEPLHGINSGMHKMVGKSYKNYIKEKKETRDEVLRTCYRVGGWTWDRRDVIIVDENENEIIDKIDQLPEPKQFNPDFLDI